MRSPSMLIALLCAGIGSSAFADTVKVENAWVRATAPGQKVAAGFLDLTADANMKLVGGSSPASNSLELHMMKMEGGVMSMRQIKEIALPHGKKVQLKPGGLHIMFIDLKAPIRAGERVPVSLTVLDSKGKQQTLQVEAETLAVEHAMEQHRH